jgi:acyl homoserine lactone synthase
MRAIIIEKAKAADQALLIEHHRLRAQVFRHKLGWDVDVVDDLEQDKFDTLQPVYVLAVDEHDTVIGCARLLPAIGPTMIQDVFPTLLRGCRLAAHKRMVESSRFCVDTEALHGGRGQRASIATMTLLSAIAEWALANDMTEIVTVTDLRFERLLARLGWSLNRLGVPRKIGVTRAVAGSLTVTPQIFCRLRPKDYHSNISSIRHTPRGALFQSCCEAAQ